VIRRIERSLDARNIVENDYKLQVLSTIFLEDRHLGLAQAVDYNNWNRRERIRVEERKEEERLLKESGANCVDREERLKWIRGEIAHKKNKMLVNDLNESYNSNPQPVSGFEKGVNAHIDSFFYTNLKSNSLLEDPPTIIPTPGHNRVMSIGESNPLQSNRRETDGENMLNEGKEGLDMHMRNRRNVIGDGKV